MNQHPLWLFWGQPSMTFLRYMTLRSACAVHDDVRLIVREPLVQDVKWAETQDFMLGAPERDWMPDALALPLTVVQLRDLAPEIHALGAPDVQTSDLLGWWLLANHGGTVCDMDIVFLRPLPKIQQAVETVVHNKAQHRYDYAPIGYLQGRPDPKWEATYRSAFQNYDPNIYQSCGGENLKPWPAPGLHPLVVYPWVGAVFRQILDYCFKARHWPRIRPECVGVHWYAGSMQKENWRVNGPDDLGAGAVAWAVRDVLSRGAKTTTIPEEVWR